MPRSPTRRPRPYHHGNLRAALIDATLSLVAEGGLPAVSLREASRRAGVSTSAPYKHFSGRTDLLAAVAEAGFEGLADTMRQEVAAAAPGDVQARFRALGLGYVRFAVVNPSYFRVMYAPELSDRTPFPGLHEAYDTAFALLWRTIADAQSAGLLPPGDPRFLAMAPWSMVHGFATLALDGQLGPMRDPIAVAAALLSIPGPAAAVPGGPDVTTR
jgi:AcrR family transcriptional regulator